MKALVLIFFMFTTLVHAQNMTTSEHRLTSKQKGIIAISACAASGDIVKLKTELNKGLDAGLTINETREVLVHLYAYCGFPRSIRGLQTLMEVIDERKAKGINDSAGREASPINQETDKYDRGRKVLSELTKTPQERPASGYGAFAPAIDVFLKEHLFADIFERDILTYAERELVTISVLSAIGGVELMLRSHLSIALNVGLTQKQLTEFTGIIRSTLGEKEAASARAVLDAVLTNKELPSNISPQHGASVFAQGEKINSSNFTGTVFLNMMLTPDNTYNTSMGNVTFEPRARTHWHKHPGGQILLVTSGKGYYQEKGKPAQVIQEGDVIKIAPDVEHWHGAASDSGLTHIAISLNLGNGGVIWLEPVTDEEYGF